MEMNLKRPIIFFDLETTGINIAVDRVVEMAYMKISPDGKTKEENIRINPGMPINPEATKVHGITNEDVKDCPSFKDVARRIADEFEGCDIAGFNSVKFDIPLLMEEFLRADVDIDLKKRNFIDVQVIFHKMEQRTLSAAYKFYCGQELKDAHAAKADVNATYEIFKKQLDRYQGVTFTDKNGHSSTPVVNDIDKLAEFTSHNQHVDYAGRIVYDEKGREVFNFGKYKNVPVEEVLEKNPGYFGWMMQGDFPLYTKKILTEIKMRKFNA